MPTLFKFRAWSYIFREAWAGVRKNGLMSIASVTTVALSLLVLAIFLVLALNMQYISDVVQSQVEVSAYLVEDFDYRYRQELIDKIKKIDGVSEVAFVTKEEGLKRLREQFGDEQELLEGVDKLNPLRDAVEIRVPELEKIPAVVKSLEEIDSVAQVRYDQEVLEKLTRFTRSARTAGLGLVVLLGLATTFLIANTVRLTVFARRKEISIMKLVGATDALIRWPFLLEGAILGLLGALLSAGVMWWGYSQFLEAVNRTLPFIPVLGGDPLLFRLAQVLLVLGVLIGAVGSGLSVRKYLRV